jgi:hypothetical protein
MGISDGGGMRGFGITPFVQVPASSHKKSQATMLSRNRRRIACEPHLDAEQNGGLACVAGWRAGLKKWGWGTACMWLAVVVVVASGRWKTQNPHKAACFAGGGSYFQCDWQQATSCAPPTRPPRAVWPPVCGLPTRACSQCTGGGGCRSTETAGGSPSPASAQQRRPYTLLGYLPADGTDPLRLPCIERLDCR